MSCFNINTLPTRFLVLHLLLIGIFFLSACSFGNSDTPTSNISSGTVTPHPLIQGEGSLLDTPVIKQVEGEGSANSLFGKTDIPTALPTSTAYPTATPKPAEPTPAPQTYRDISLYNDQLDPNWSLGKSAGLTYDTQSTSTVYTGTTSISVVPEQGFGILFFTVNENTNQTYLRNDVLGLRFRVNSGNDYLALEDMAVSILGSNVIPYWAEEDKSVESTIGEYPFSETKLYFLGFNEDIPPNTWVDVEVWQDNLLFDPDYLYVTGFYIKHGDGYRTNYFVDDVALIFAEEQQ